MADVEARAREMGWKPQAEFRGDPEKWVPAETYVERGETVLPIVKAQKEKLERDVTELKTQLREAQEAIAGSKEAIAALEEFYTEETKRQVAKARADLRAQIKTARDDGDIDGELAAQEELTRLNAAESAAKAGPAETKKPEAPAPTAEYLAWQAENPWFLSDPKKARRSFLVATELKEEQPTLVGTAFYTELDRRLISEGVKEGRSASPSKVEGGGRSSGERGETVMGYDDLPADAKAACDKQGRALVGKGRKFETIAAWRKYYVEVYSKEY